MVVVTRSMTASSAQRNRGRPVVMQRQVPTMQNIQKTVGAPQVHFIGKDTVDVRVVLQRHVLVVRKVQKTVEVRQVKYIDGKLTLRISISTTFPSPRTFVSATLLTPMSKHLEETFAMVTSAPQEQVQQRTVEQVGTAHCLQQSTLSAPKVSTGQVCCSKTHDISFQRGIEVRHWSSVRIRALTSSCSKGLVST